MKTAAIFLASLLLTQIPLQPITALPKLSDPRIAQEDILTPQEVQQTAKNITVRVSSENNGGSGVIIAQKGNNYLILTNAHVIRRATKIEIQAPDGQKYKATPLDGGFDAKYDLALLQFTSRTKYTLPDLSGISSSPIDPSRIIYSAGFPFDSRDLRITRGQVSQLSDIPFDDGTQIGYITNKGEKGIRQGMSGGAIFDARGVFLGINTIGIAPILPDYTYSDGSKPLPKLTAKYQQANWGIPVYNFLTRVKPDILYGYANLPKVEHQVTPTGYMARLNIGARRMTVRIESSGGSGSGVIVAREGSSYYVLTAKHVVKPESVKGNPNSAIFPDLKTTTFDQESYAVDSINVVLAEGIDLAIVKFTSSNNYPVAALGDYAPSGGAIVFAGGFPSRNQIDSPLWQWQLNPGIIFAKDLGKFYTQDKESFSQGYNLLYTSITYGGMSGGPIFDTEGRVVGIHGKAEGEKKGTKELILGNSLGISIQDFIGIAKRLNVPQSIATSKNSPRNLNPNDGKTVLAILTNISEPQSASSDRQWLQYGNQLYRIRKYPQAVKAFDIAIAKNQENKLLGNYGKALALAYGGQLPQALIAISTAIAATPVENRQKYYYLWKYQSMIFLGLEKYDESIRSINIAISLEPTDRLLRSRKAGVLYQQKEYQAAILIYDELIKNQPEADIYNDRGILKLKLGNKEAAIADYDLAIGLNPKLANAYGNRANAKLAQGNKEAAIADYNLAISIDPKLANAYGGRGNAKLALGDKAAAIADFDRAIAINPKFAEVYNLRANAKSAQGNKDTAIADYDRAIAINPKLAYNYYDRGIVKSEQGNKEAAILDYDRAINLDPKLAVAYGMRGNAKLALGDKAAAILDYDRAIALDPKLAIAYGARGNAKSDLGNKQAAIIDYDKAIEINPKFAMAYIGRGVAKLGLGDKAGAIIDYDRAIALDPKFAEAYFRRGSLKSDLGNKQAAIIDLDRAITLDPKLAMAYGMRGNAKLALGNKADAILDYDRAINLDPKLVEAYLRRASAKFDLGNKQAAIIDYDKAIVLNPKLAIAYAGRGNAKLALGNKESAIIDLDQAINLDPKLAVAYGMRGNAKLALGDKAAAILDYDRAIAIDPKLVEAYFRRGNAKAALGNKQAAIIDYDRAIALNPKFAMAYTVRGGAKLALENKAAAIIDLDQAIKLDPKLTIAYVGRGSAKLELGDKQAAIIDHDRAIALDPKFAEAYNGRSIVKLELGDNSGAILDLDRAISINPKFTAAYSNRGFMKIIIGKESDALLDIEQSIRLDSNIRESYACRGFIKEMFGDKQMAISDYKRAIQIDPQQIQKWKKQAESLRPYNAASYQKYQQMIQKLELGAGLK